jgi:hypothetical protein
VTFWGVSFALVPFWCLDAKGGEVVLVGLLVGMLWWELLFSFSFLAYELIVELLLSCAW